jgi:hypothetical protein
MSKKDSININSGGGPVFTGKVDNRKGKISGRSNKYSNGLNGDEVFKLFNSLFVTIDQHSKLSKNDKADLKEEIQEIRQELTKKRQADEGLIMRRLRNSGRMAPDILEVTLATIINPMAGFGVIAKKVAEKAKASAG